MTMKMRTTPTLLVQPNLSLLLPQNPLAVSLTATTVCILHHSLIDRPLTEVPGHCDAAATAAATGSGSATASATESDSAAVTDNAAVIQIIPFAGIVAAAVLAL